VLCVVCVCSKIRDDEFSFFLFFCFLSKVLVRRPFSLVVVCIFFLDPPPKISAPIILHNGFLMTPYETLMYYSFER
jgi:hypothetical protein